MSRIVFISEDTRHYNIFLYCDGFSLCKQSQCFKLWMHPLILLNFIGVLGMLMTSLTTMT